MKKLLIILLLPLSCWSAEYVQACRADLNIEVESAALPLSTYTNGLKFWMDARSGLFNAGATNYFIAGFSTNKNNATQTVINSQPTLVYTNGAWGYFFDGTDNFAKTTIVPTSNTVVYADVYVSSTNTAPVLGTRESAAVGYYYLVSSGGTWLYRYGTNVTNVGGATVGQHTIVFDYTGLVIDGTKVVTNGVPYGGSFTMPLYLGFINDGSDTWIPYFSGTINSLWIQK